MTQQAYRILAVHSRSGQRLTQQFLDGTLITDRTIAWQLAEKFAAKQTARDRATWLPQVESYTARV